jgi:hypothetical protein
MFSEGHTETEDGNETEDYEASVELWGDAIGLYR